jgi:hypothetical protein
VIRG